MVPAIASISWKLLEPVKRACLATFWANGFLAVSNLEKMRQAGVIIGVRLKELLNSPAFGHSTLRHY
jgi:hypothetical protein